MKTWPWASSVVSAPTSAPKVVRRGFSDARYSSVPLLGELLRSVVFVQCRPEPKSDDVLDAEGLCLDCLGLDAGLPQEQCSALHYGVYVFGASKWRSAPGSNHSQPRSGLCFWQHQRRHLRCSFDYLHLRGARRDSPWAGCWLPFWDHRGLCLFFHRIEILFAENIWILPADF